MTAPISLEDMFRIVIYILTIGVLGYLILLFKNAAELLKGINNLSKENYKEIDKSIKNLSYISENINSITETTDRTMDSVMPEIDSMIHNANKVSSKIESMTNVLGDASNKVSETVDDVTDNISQTAFKFTRNMDNISYYLAIVNEIIDVIKNVILGR